MICKPCARATDNNAFADHDTCIDVVGDHDYRSCDCQHKKPHRPVDVPMEVGGE